MKKPAPEPIRHIPWGYGMTRVTAMAVDPERLYAYWEITDPDLERARAALPLGADIRLVLRIFDTTGRIFDGTNAHHSFDVAIGRSDRQWFLNLNRPNSTAVVEVALIGPQGSYVPLARSKPVDFPRRDPAPPSEPEWRVAQEAATSSRIPKVRLVSPSPNDQPRTSPLESQGKPKRTLSPQGVPVTGSSEARLGDQVPSGGGSEARLRDKQNGSAGLES